MPFPFQSTLSNKVSCIGVGLHSGRNVRMSLGPADEGSGIVFKRNDVKDKNPVILGNYQNVTDTTLCTTLSNEEGVLVATVEHLMAAFWGCGIDNALVELDSFEVPIMDGSSEPFVFLVECAGVKKQSSPKRVIEVLRAVEVVEDNKRVAIMPSDSFSVSVEIDFNDKVIANQRCVFNSSDVSFKTDLCRARSFCFEHEVVYMQQNGLAQGGSLDNAIVVSEDGILNVDGLRYHDEFVRHKVLDCIGDFYLTGVQLVGRFVGFRSGHSLNNKLLHKFFSDKSAWREIKHIDDSILSRCPGAA